MPQTQAPKTSLQEIIVATDPVFEAPLSLPPPPESFRRNLEALAEANLKRQRGSLLFDMRCWQAEKLGLKRFDKVAAIVPILMGEESSHFNVFERASWGFEYCYDHHKDSASSEYIMHPWVYELWAKRSAWYAPPFFATLQWKVVAGPLDCLKRDIPYGVILRVNELKKLKLFNCFMAVAPEEAWRTSSQIDPVIIARISEMPAPKEQGGPNILSEGKQAFFFVAQW